MSYKNVGSAGDLVRFECSLKVECIFCGSARTMNGGDVVRVHGTRRLEQLAPRLKCSRCKRKDAKLTVLGPVYPD